MKTIDRDTVKAVLDLFAVEGCDFHFNQPNNYGTINLCLYTGPGDSIQYRGEEQTSEFRAGTRPNGLFKLNDRAVDFVIGQILRQQTLDK